MVFACPPSQNWTELTKPTCLLQSLSCMLHQFTSHPSFIRSQTVQVVVVVVVVVVIVVVVVVVVQVGVVYILFMHSRVVYEQYISYSVHITIISTCTVSG